MREGRGRERQGCKGESTNRLSQTHHANDMPREVPDRQNYQVCFACLLASFLYIVICSFAILVIIYLSFSFVCPSTI